MEYRRLPIGGVRNIRDLGGYPTQGGGVTAFRRFIRSEAPRALKDSDINFLKAYGVTMTIDFRGDGEIERLPNSLAEVAGIKYCRCVTFDKQVAFSSEGVNAGEGGTAPEGGAAPESSVVSESGATSEGGAASESDKATEGGATSEAGKATEGGTAPVDGTEPADGKPPEKPTVDAFVDWGEKYVEIVTNSSHWVRDTLRLMAASDGAVLFNCATGKDRTGIIAALLLGIAGVAEYDIVADYCVSELYLRELYEELLANFLERWPDQKADINSPFFKTAPANMETLLKHINETYGSIEGYVKSCGIEEKEIAALRERLIDAG